MKKLLTILFVFFVTVSSSRAQFVETAKIASDGTRITASGENNRGAAFNSATNHYLVATRTGTGSSLGIYTYAYTPATGALTFDATGGTGAGSLDVTGITGGTVALYDVEVADDGVIYASNLITNPTTTAFKIYRWATESSSISTAFNATIPSLAATERMGDSFEVYGSGTNTVILVSGNHASSMVYKFVTADGVNFTYDSKITIVAQSAGHGIAHIGGGAFYASRSNAGVAIGQYPAIGGAVATSTLSTSYVTDVHNDIDYLEAGGKKWLAVAADGTVSGGGAKLIDVTDGDALAKIYGKTPNLGTNTNTTGTAADVEIIYDAGTNSITLLTLVDNNGIAAYRTTLGLTGVMVKWDGGAGDGKWTSPTNWNGDVVPRCVDDVILDNTSVSGSYSVTLTGMETICVKSLQIGYTGNVNTITLTIDNLSKANELYFGDQVTGNDDLIIEAGGVLHNASTATAGDVLKRRFATSTTVGDKFVIRAGGTYQHNSGRSAANPWFDAGAKTLDAESNFEYHLTAGTPSFSGRTYGNLKLVPASAKTWSTSGANALTCTDLIIGANATITDTGTGNFNIASDFTIAGTLTLSGSGGLHRSIVFNGSTPQVYTRTGTLTGGAIPGGVTMNGVGGLTLNTALDVNGNLTMTNGIITTTNTNLLTLGTGSTTSGASATSYVNGPLAKVGGAAAFTYPVGKVGKYRPIGVANTVATSTFRAEYFDTVHPSAAMVTAPLVEVSDSHYWDLSRTAGANTADVVLMWDASSGVTDYNTAVVGHFNGASWEQLTTAAPTGDNSAGTITAAGVSSFSPFALGGTLLSTLPVSVTTATTAVIEGKVALRWSTASETNNDAYTIEHRVGTEGLWKQIGSVKGAGTSIEMNTYEFTTEKLMVGTHQFRIKSSDDKITQFKDVNIELVDKFVLYNAYPNPFNHEATIHFAVAKQSQVNIALYNALGQKVASLFEGESAANELQTINISAENLPNGIYFVSMSGEGINAIQKITILR